jgi:APA family basic amino acid/polyamine antiporter
VTQPELARRLGIRDAVIIGLGSMLGAGVFAAFSPAARVAGAGLLIGLAIAALVAYCNATASAQLAAQYPTSGGTYIYGRELTWTVVGLLPDGDSWSGRRPRWARTTFAAYLAPAGWWRSRSQLGCDRFGDGQPRVTRTGADKIIVVPCSRR